MQRSKLLMVSMAVVVAGGLGAIGAGSAFAATGGAEVAVCQNGSTDYRGVTVRGTNQNGDNVSFDFTTAKDTCTTTTGFWWTGDLSVNWYKSDSTDEFTVFNDVTDCDVPDGVAENVPFRCAEMPTL